MVETDQNNKNYELAYHINPDLEEAEVKMRAQELNELISKSGGSILISRDPRKSHLSYPIKNNNYAYFGTMDFSISPESIEKINSQMKLLGDVLRYLLLSKPTAKELRILGQHRSKPKIKTHESIVTVEPQKPKTMEETKQLEEELEKVIEGLK
ncbi:MAG: 30S ribosomal protein S6 [Patescibacteria group bacterium]